MAIAAAGTRYRLSVTRPASSRAIAYAHSTKPAADGARPRKTMRTPSPYALSR
jgi:hypothetical protein